jgi:hypothetical protein
MEPIFPSKAVQAQQEKMDEVDLLVLLILKNANFHGLVGAGLWRRARVLNGSNIPTTQTSFAI